MMANIRRMYLRAEMKAAGIGRLLLRVRSFLLPRRRRQ